MGEQSGIEWTTATWNPVIGCAKVSPACTNCYAEEYAAKRLKRPDLWRGARHVTSRSVWNLPERVDRKAAREGRRVRLFVSSLADVFEDHPVWTGLRSFALAKLEALEHTDVLLLTKRPENIRGMVPSSWLDAWPAHVWTGATVEDQQRADERIPELLKVPGPHFLSMEPLLGPVDLSPWLRPEQQCERCDSDCSTCPLDRAVFVDEDFDERSGDHPARSIDWVIAGGESGQLARPSHPDWFRSVRDQCARAAVPFMFKQWGEWIPRSHTTGRHPWHDERTPDGDPSWRVPAPGRLALGWGTITRDRFWPTTMPFNGHDDDEWGEAIMHRLGTKRAGRMLDGVLHDAFPESFGVTHG